MSDNPLLEKVEQNPVTGALPLCGAKPIKGFPRNRGVYGGFPRKGVNWGKAPLYGMGSPISPPKSSAQMVRKGARAIIVGTLRGVEKWVFIWEMSDNFTHDNDANIG